MDKVNLTESFTLFDEMFSPGSWVKSTICM